MIHSIASVAPAVKVPQVWRHLRLRERHLHVAIANVVVVLAKVVIATAFCSEKEERPQFQIKIAHVIWLDGSMPLLNTLNVICFLASRGNLESVLASRKILLVSALRM